MGELLEGKPLDVERIMEVANVQKARARSFYATLARLPEVKSVTVAGAPTLRLQLQELKKSRLTSNMMIALYLGSSLSRLFEGTTVGLSMNELVTFARGRALRKADHRDLDRKFVFAARGGEYGLRHRDQALKDVVGAVLESSPIRFDYEHFEGNPERLALHPYTLAIYQHQLYVIGRNDKAEVRAYRFARFKNVEVEEGAFEYPTPLEYDPECLLDKSFGIFISETFPVDEVVVRLAPKWALYARTHRWHSKQQNTIEPDGSVLVKLHVRVCPEIQNWIQGFGEDAEVLRPISLRERVGQSLRTAAAKYALAAPGVRGARRRSAAPGIPVRSSGQRR